MLTQMRKSAGSWMVKALMLLLVASFAVWGIGDYVGGGNEQIVAEVGDQQLPATAFQQEFRQQLAQVQRRTGQRIDMQQARDLGLVDEILQQQIDRLLLEQTAARMNLRAPEDILRALILQDPGFTNDQGEFDRFRFQNFLAQAGMTEPMFVDAMRDEVRSLAISRSLVAGKAPAPEALTQALRNYVGERRDVDYLVIAKAGIPAPDAPAEADLRSYYNDNPEAYTAPELRSLSWIELTPAALADRVEIGEADIEAAFEDRRDQLTVTPKRGLRQVTTDDEATARALSEAVAEGAGLADAAQQVGTTPPIELGELAQDDLASILGDEAAGQVFAASEPGVLPPLQSPFGWHVVEVTEMTDGASPTYEEVRDSLAERLRTEAAIDMAYSMANQVEDLIAGGARLKEIAETVDLPMQRHDGVDATGRDIDGKPADLAPGLGTLRRELWTMEAGGEPETFENDRGEGFTVVQLDGIAAPRLRSFEDVAEQVRSDWTQERRAELAMKEAEQIARNLEGGADIHDVAAGAGLTVSEPPPFTRFGDGAQVPFDPALTDEVFAAPAGSVVTGRTRSGDAVVARVSEIQPMADDELATELEAQLADRWSGGFKSDLSEAFRTGLADRIGVTVNRSAVDNAI